MEIVCWPIGVAFDTRFHYAKSEIQLSVRNTVILKEKWLGEVVDRFHTALA